MWNEGLFFFNLVNNSKGIFAAVERKCINFQKFNKTERFVPS